MFTNVLWIYIPLVTTSEPPGYWDFWKVIRTILQLHTAHIPNLLHNMNPE